MHISTRRTLRLAVAALVVAPLSIPGRDLAAQPADDRPLEWRVATAVLALPPSLRADAEVRARTDGPELEVLREGSNGMICRADEPGEGLGLSCYHESLEPFMARGRMLSAQGVDGMERQQARWAAVEAGEVPVPDHPAMVYNLGYDREDIDPATFDWETASRLHAVYMPYATAESTGLPIRPTGSAPWLMWPGQPSAHVMIGLPARAEGSGGG